MLPHNMLTVLYRNVLHVISLLRKNSNCCEAQNVPFCSGMSTCQCNKPHLQMAENHKQVGFLQTAPHFVFRSLLSHCSSVSQWLPCCVLYGSYIQILPCCLLHLYVVLNAARFLWHIFIISPIAQFQTSATVKKKLPIPLAPHAHIHAHLPVFKIFREASEYYLWLV